MTLLARLTEVFDAARQDAEREVLPTYRQLGSVGAPVVVRVQHALDGGRAAIETADAVALARAVVALQEVRDEMELG